MQSIKEVPAPVKQVIEPVHMEDTPSFREYPCNPGGIPPVNVESGDYRLRFAYNPDDLDAIGRLRFEVYNLELGEGLDVSYLTGRDFDEFDAQCHHLMVLEKAGGRLVGTYRIQTGSMALLRKGFYSAQEFNLENFPRMFLDGCVEVGRACIDKDHRQGRVLQLLWKGLAKYMEWNGKRYLFGCCSLNSQDASEGQALYQRLSRMDYLHPVLAAPARPDFACDATALSVLESPPPRLPRLFEGYLNLGALVCGGPALDRRFKTIDFLVCLDTREMHPGVFRRMAA